MRRNNLHPLTLCRILSLSLMLFFLDRSSFFAAYPDKRLLSNSLPHCRYTSILVTQALLLWSQQSATHSKGENLKDPAVFLSMAEPLT